MKDVTLKFKRSFIGYDPTAVADKLETINQKFARKSTELRQELAAQVHLKELLKIEVDRIKLNLSAKVAIQDEITQRLVTAHFTAAKKVIDAIKDVEKNEIETTKSISVRKEELNELSLRSSKMRNEFLSLAARYGNVFGWGNEGEVHDED